jgi:hypothetical protein
MSGSEYLLKSYGQFEKMTFFPPDPLLEEHISVFNCLDSLRGLMDTLVVWIQSQLVRIRVFIEFGGVSTVTSLEPEQTSSTN